MTATATVPRPADSFVHDAWQALEQTYRAEQIRLEPAYVEGMAQLWTSLPREVFRLVLATNRAMFANRAVLHARLCSISREETCGASLLAWASQRCDEWLAPLLDDHARDERRHARIYLAVGDLVCPERSASRARSFTVEAEQEMGGEVDPAEVPNLLASMHVGEVRNLMNLELYLALAREMWSPQDGRIEAALASVRADEVRHATYTGRMVNGWIRDDARLRGKFGDLVRTYVVRWWEDVERIAVWFERAA